jgi:zinc protease
MRLAVRRSARRRPHCLAHVLASLLLAGFAAGPLLAQSANQPADVNTDMNAKQDPAAEGSADAEPIAGVSLLQQRDDRLVAELDNRMIVLAQRVPTAPVVSAQVWVKTGSIYEQEHVGAGLSHYLEHLLSGGTTTNRTESENNAILGRIGAQTNAATSLDTVRYYINTTADQAPTAIDLLSDWMQNSKITEREFERERQVILREFSMGQGDPGRIFWKLTQQARYKTHPAKHPTIGYVERFKDITREEITDFYHRMYVPNNMVFVVTGDIDPRQMVQEVAKRWKDQPAGDLPDLSFPEEPSIDQPRTVEGRADIQQPRVRLAWPGTTLGGEHDYALDLLGVILGQGESSRLKQNIRDQKGLVTTIDAYNASFHWGKGFFGVDATVADFEIPQSQTEKLDHEPDTTQARIQFVKQAVLNQVAKIRTKGISQNELARAQRMVIADVVKSNQGVQSIASRMAQDTIAMADPDYLAKYADRIKKVTAGELQTAAEKLLTDDRLIAVKLLPATEDQPVTDMSQPAADGESETAADGQQKRDEHAITLDNRRLLDELQNNLAATDGAARTFEVSEPKRYDLDNGLRLIVQKSTVVPAVSMHMYWLGGLLGDPADQPGTANAMARMMTRGTEQHSADELASAIESLGASLSANAGNNTTYVQAAALKEDWQRVMGLMAEVTLSPTFPEDQWQKMRPRLLAAIQRQDDSWVGELQNHFRRSYFADHPWANTPLGQPEVLKKLTPDQLAAHHKRNLAAGRAVMAVVGDVEPEKVKAQVQALFHNMPTQGQASFDPPSPDIPKPKLLQKQTDKPVAAVQIGLGPGLKRNSASYPAMRVLANVMSDFPGGWLEQQLRGSGQGLAYAVGAHVQSGLVPGYFTVLFNASPDTTPKALRKAVNIIQRAKQQPIPPDDLQRAKAKTLTSEFLGRQSNSQRATNMALDQLYGVSDPQGVQFIEHVQSVDAETLNDVAKRYLHNPVALVISQTPIDEAALQAAMKGKKLAPEPAVTQPATQPLADDAAATQPSQSRAADVPDDVQETWQQPDYILTPGDKLKITITQPEVYAGSGTVTVGEGGLIELPTIGQVRVGDLPARLAVTQIEHLLLSQDQANGSAQATINVLQGADNPRRSTTGADASSNDNASKTQ